MERNRFCTKRYRNLEKIVNKKKEKSGRSEEEDDKLNIGGDASLELDVSLSLIRKNFKVINYIFMDNIYI